MSRRLPIYLVLDTSGSMTGDPITAVENGLQLLVSSLRNDPHALETAYLSIITFNETANQIIPLTNMTDFQPPSLQASGTTSFGQALSLTADCIGRDVNKSSADTKGDWKPLVFIMTDGLPTDDWQSGLSKFKAAKIGVVVACAAGGEADENLLKQVTDNVVRLDTADSASIAAYFEWVSSSISTSSKRIELDKTEGEGDMNQLPPPPPELNLV